MCKQQINAPVTD